MDPTAFCRETMQALRAAADEGSLDQQAAQQVVILSSFSQQDLSPQAFTTALSLLAEQAMMSGRTGMAEAARDVLDAWQSVLRGTPPQ